MYTISSDTELLLKFAILHFDSSMHCDTIAGNKDYYSTVRGDGGGRVLADCCTSLVHYFPSMVGYNIRMVFKTVCSTYLSQYQATPNVLNYIFQKF